MLNELLCEINEMRRLASESPEQRLVRVYCQFRPEARNAIETIDGDPYFVPLFVKEGKRHKDGTTTTAHRIKADLTLAKPVQIICETYPDSDPTEPDCYEWNLDEEVQNG